MIALEIIFRRHGKARRRTRDEGGSSQGACTLLGEFRRLAVDMDGHGTGRGPQPMGVEGHCETAQDRYPQVGDKRDNNRRFHRRLTFARGVWRRSRSIFSTSIEGEDIAACGSECDIGSDNC